MNKTGDGEINCIRNDLTKRRAMGFLKKNGTLCLVGVYIYDLAPVFQKVDNAIRRINHYPVDKSYRNHLCYPMDSDLSGGKCCPPFEQLGSGGKNGRKVLHSSSFRLRHFAESYFGIVSVLH